MDNTLPYGAKHSGGAGLRGALLGICDNSHQTSTNSIRGPKQIRGPRSVLSRLRRPAPIAKRGVDLDVWKVVKEFQSLVGHSNTKLVERLLDSVKNWKPRYFFVQWRGADDFVCGWNVSTNWQEKLSQIKPA
ncbi:hypothetical protein ACLOJK_021942 [Asimina triloba]